MIVAQSTALVIGFILNLLIGADFGRVMEKTASGIEKIMRKIFPKKKGGEKVAGFFTLFFVVAIFGGAVFAILFFAYRFHMVVGAVVEGIVCFLMLSSRKVSANATRVYDALMQGDIEKAKKHLSAISACDTDNLDDTGITKMTVEAVAENILNGIVSPIIFMALGGGVLGSIYRAVIAVSSALDLRNEECVNSGACASMVARSLNYIPSRICARIMIWSVYLLGFDGKNAVKTYKRGSYSDILRVKAVVAGALKIQLAGDASYYGRLHDEPSVGEAIRDIQYYNIRNTNKMMYMTAVIAVILLVGIKFAIGLFV